MKLLQAKPLMFIGFLLLAGGFFYDVMFAGIPYQDPTPELQANWNYHSGIAQNIMMTGVVAIVTGIFVAIFRKLFRA